MLINCVGQPVLFAGELNADLAGLPCLAKGISAGWFCVLMVFHLLLPVD